MLICVIIGTSDRAKLELMFRGVNKLVENQESSKYLIERLKFQNQGLQVQLRNSKLTHEAEMSKLRRWLSDINHEMEKSRGLLRQTRENQQNIGSKTTTDGVASTLGSKGPRNTTMLQSHTEIVQQNNATASRATQPGMNPNIKPSENVSNPIHASAHLAELSIPRQGDNENWDSDPDQHRPAGSEALDASDGRNRDHGLADTPVIEQNSQVNQNSPSTRAGRTIYPNLNPYGDLDFDWAEYVRNHVSKTVESELNKHIASLKMV